MVAEVEVVVERDRAFQRQPFVTMGELVDALGGGTADYRDGLLGSVNPGGLNQLECIVGGVP